MSDKDSIPPALRFNRDSIAHEIMNRASEDMVFSVRFLGDSQYRLHRHFQNFIEAELAKKGATRDNYPLLQVFIDTHAAELRDFVFTGVALARQFRIGEMEALSRNQTALLRVDIWDALVSHIQMAEERFCEQVSDLPRLLGELQVQEKGQSGQDP